MPISLATMTPLPWQAEAWRAALRPGGGALGWAGGKGCVMPSGALEHAQWTELLTAEAAGCIALIILSAWGAVWSMTPLALRIHTASVGRSTIKPDEVQHIARRLRGVEWLV